MRQAPRFSFGTGLASTSADCCRPECCSRSAASDNFPYPYRRMNFSQSISRARKRESPPLRSHSDAWFSPSIPASRADFCRLWQRLRLCVHGDFPRRPSRNRAQRANSRNSTLQPPIHSRYFAVSGDSSRRRTDFSQSALAIAFANNARTFAFMAIPAPLRSISKRAAQSSLLKIGRRHAAAHWHESQFSHAA